MESALKSLRELASSSIEKGAQIASVSYGHLWNVEHDLAKLSDSQMAALQEFYFAEIQARLQRVEAAVERLSR